MTKSKGVVSMGLFDRLSNFIGNTFGAEVTHQTSIDEMASQDFDSEGVFGMDEDKLSEFKGFCDYEGYSAENIDTLVRPDGIVVVTVDIDNVGNRAEVTIDRESGRIENATEYYTDGSRYEHDIEGTKDAIDTNNSYPKSYQTEEQIKVGCAYDSDGKLVHKDGYSDGQIQDTKYAYDNFGREVSAKTESYDQYSNSCTTTENITRYGDNGEISTQITITGEYDGRDTNTEPTYHSTTRLDFREDGTLAKETTISKTEDLYHEDKADTSSDTKIYDTDGKTVIRRETTTVEHTSETVMYEHADYDEEQYEYEEDVTIRTVTVETPEYTSVDTAYSGARTEHITETRYTDGSVTERIYESNDINYTEQHRSPDGTITSKTEYDGKTEKVSHMNADGDVREVEYLRNGELERTEYLDSEGRVEMIGIYGEDPSSHERVLVSHIDVQYDGDNKTEIVFDSNGDYVKTIEEIKIDSEITIKIETTADGNETISAIREDENGRTETLSLDSRTEVDGKTEYHFSGDLSNDSVDGARHITLTYDKDGQLTEKIDGSHFEKIGLDSRGEDTAQWGATDYQKAEYHEDGSRTETVYQSTEGYRGSDTGGSITVITEYDKDGNRERESTFAENHQAWSDKEENGKLVIVEYQEDGTQKATVIDNINANEIEKAIENPENYDRDITYVDSDGSRTTESFTAGENIIDTSDKESQSNDSAEIGDNDTPTEDFNPDSDFSPDDDFNPDDDVNPDNDINQYETDTDDTTDW